MLCKEAVSAQNQADVERIVSELRKALNEHIRYARVSLEVQAKIFIVHSRQVLKSMEEHLGEDDDVAA
jgi:molybdopterin converting factor small subunit